MATMEAAAPPRSLQQRMEALRRANEVRTRRARLKKDVKAGEVDPGSVLDDPAYATMKLIDLLLAVPKVGRTKANRVLVMNRISPSKTLGGLSDRQRGALRLWLHGFLWRG